MVTLAGWSRDGRTWAALVEHDGDRRSQQLVIYRDGQPIEHHGGEGPCAEGARPIPHVGSTRYTPAERVDIRTYAPLRAHRLEPVSAAWRESFARDLAIEAGGLRTFEGLPGSTGPIACPSEVVRRRGQVTPLAVLPGACDPDATDCYALEVLGGYHSADRGSVVKLRERRCGHRAGEGFRRIALDQGLVK